MKETRLIERLAENGYRGAVVSLRSIQELDEEIGSDQWKAQFESEFFEERLTKFSFDPPENLPEAESVIVVAVGDPQKRVTFNWNGKIIHSIVPPTYLHWKQTDQKVEAALTEILAQQGYRAVPASLPKKIVAVRSGLADYGRNNITYIDGLGSFHRLAIFWSDRPCEEDNWRNVAVMDVCEGCEACIDACPTGAIDSERFLLHAERCIVFLNEKPGDVPFPAWLDPATHNCLVGCMICQSVCPVDSGFIEWIEDEVEFSEEETDLIIAGTPAGELPEPLLWKLEVSDLLELLDFLPRNLKALIAKDRYS